MARVRDQAKYEEQRAYILDSALQLFRKFGYQGTKLEEVARRAGMTKAAVYYYFPTKADLLVESCRSVVDLGLEQIRRIELDEGLTSRERLQIFVRQHLELLAENLEAFAVIFEDLRISQDAGTKPLRDAQRKFGEVLERIIAKGVNSGEFRAMDPQLVANGILGMCNWSYRWMGRNSASTKDTIEAFSSLILEGLASTPD